MGGDVVDVVHLHPLWYSTYMSLQSKHQKLEHDRDDIAYCSLFVDAL
jgi:hypothetical protein